MSLTPKQEHVLILIANGRTILAAAQEAGVTRNTFFQWRRTSPEFREYFAIAEYKRAAHWQQKLQALAELAITNLGRILTNPDELPAIRAKAALYVLDYITQLPPTQPELAADRAAPRTSEDSLEEEIEEPSIIQ